MLEKLEQRLIAGLQRERGLEKEKPNDPEVVRDLEEWTAGLERETDQEPNPALRSARGDIARAQLYGKSGYVCYALELLADVRSLHLPRLVGHVAYNDIEQIIHLLTAEFTEKSP